MINKEIILKTLNDAIAKCGPTIAQRYARFNAKDFKEDTFPADKRKDPSPIGRLQKIQEDLQEDIDYEWIEEGTLFMYTLRNFWEINAWNNKSKYHKNWKSLIYESDYERYDVDPLNPLDYKVKVTLTDRLKTHKYVEPKTKEEKTLTIPEEADIMEKMIDKSPPLQENTILWRFGHWDVGLKAGDTGKWNSFTSTSFNSYVAKKRIKTMQFSPSEDRYQIKIYTPQGTKGIVPCENTNCEDFQSEFLLQKGQKYIVLNVDDDNRTAEILLY